MSDLKMWALSFVATLAFILAVMSLHIARTEDRLKHLERISSPEVEWCLSKVNRFGLREVQLEPE